MPSNWVKTSHIAAIVGCDVATVGRYLGTRFQSGKGAVRVLSADEAKQVIAEMRLARDMKPQKIKLEMEGDDGDGDG